MSRSQDTKGCELMRKVAHSLTLWLRSTKKHRKTNNRTLAPDIAFTLSTFLIPPDLESCSRVCVQWKQVCDVPMIQNYYHDLYFADDYGVFSSVPRLAGLSAGAFFLKRRQCLGPRIQFSLAELSREWSIVQKQIRQVITDIQSAHEHLIEAQTYRQGQHTFILSVSEIIGRGQQAIDLMRRDRFEEAVELLVVANKLVGELLR